MHVLVTSEHHFDRTPDGRVWTDGPFAVRFWTRYLAVFDSVSVLARVRAVDQAPPGGQFADGVKIAFIDVPDYTGPEEYLACALRVRSVATAAVEQSQAVILRVPGQMGRCIDRLLRRRSHPYAVEVVGDPYDVFSPGAVRHPLRPVFRWEFTRRLREQCAGACAAAYVTQCALQARYPAARDGFATYYSDVELPDEAFASTPRRPQSGRVRLVFVGSLAQMYKAPDVLIDAVAVCLREGLDLELAMVGSGRCEPDLKARAESLMIGHRVRFCGQLTTAEADRAELDAADLFVLPSLVEGLPRAMIEAMARALPCIGTSIGGIPELLPGEDLVSPGDTGALAQKIREVLSDENRMARMSERNLEKAKEFRPENLMARREEFYRFLHARTEAFLDGVAG